MSDAAKPVQTSWTKSEFAPFALTPVLLVVGWVLWPVLHGNLWDIFFISFGLPVGIILCRRTDLWPLLGFLICFLWAVDLCAYSVAHPLADPIWEPVVGWFHGASLSNLGWVLRTAGFVTFVIAFLAAVKHRLPFAGLLAGLMACVMIGSGPAYLKKGELHYSVQRMDTFDQAAIDSLMASQPSREIEVQVVPDDSHSYPGILVRANQVIIVRFDSEITDFWLKGVRDWNEAKKAGPRYNSATFAEPCLLLSGVMTNTPRSDYPLDPVVWDSLAVSVNAIHVGGGICAPVIKQTEVYMAQRDGEVTMNYNLPRGKNSYVKAGSYGRRLFKVWVLDLDQYLKTQSEIKTAAL